MVQMLVENVQPKIERSKVKPIPNTTTSSDSDKEIQFNLIKENLPGKETRSKTSKTSKTPKTQKTPKSRTGDVTPSRKRKISEDSNDGYSPLTTSGPSDESCAVTPQVIKKKVENENRKPEKLPVENTDISNETPKRTNVKETISKQKTRSKRLMKEVLESQDNNQSAAEACKKTGAEKGLNAEQVENDLGVKMMYEMPSEKRSSHIKQAWKPPRLSNGRRNGTPPEIKSPQSHHIGSRALGMGLSKFARTQEYV